MSDYTHETKAAIGCGAFLLGMAFLFVAVAICGFAGELALWAWRWIW